MTKGYQSVPSIVTRRNDRRGKCLEDRGPDTISGQSLALSLARSQAASACRASLRASSSTQTCAPFTATHTRSPRLSWAHAISSLPAALCLSVRSCLCASLSDTFSLARRAIATAKHGSRLLCQLRHRPDQLDAARGHVRCSASTACLLRRCPAFWLGGARGSVDRPRVLHRPRESSHRVGSPHRAGRLATVFVRPPSIVYDAKLWRRWAAIRIGRRRASIRQRRRAGAGAGGAIRGGGGCRGCRRRRTICPHTDLQLFVVLGASR